MPVSRKLEIPIALITTCFALFFFIFADMGIGMVYPYLVMGVLLITYLCVNPHIYCTRISIAYVVLAVVACLFSLLPYSLHSYDVTTLMISIMMCSILSLVSQPKTKELNRILKLIVLIALVTSIYVIIVAVFPNIYADFISAFVEEETRENTLRMLKYNYGVMIGGNVTLVNHILVLALLIIINKQFIYNDKKGVKVIRSLLMVFIGLSAMILENRKGELIVFIIVVVYAFCFGSCLDVNKRLKKALLYIFAGALLIITVFMIALQHGHVERYLTFISLFESGDMVRSTTGRLTLWNTAIRLFLENPIFGIGWGNARQYIYMVNPLNQLPIYNVHSILLQILCETGIVGCILFMGPAVYIIFQMKRTVKYLRNKKDVELLPKILASVALEYQLFLLLNGMIDSTWHRISFWPFYSISIIMAIAAQRISNIQPR